MSLAPLDAKPPAGGGPSGTWVLADEGSPGDPQEVYQRALALVVDDAPPPAAWHYVRTTARTRNRRGLLWLGQTCNLRCHFCYFLDRIESPTHPEHAFMSLAKAKAICDTLVAVYGNNAIDIQGGEPTLFPGILELVRHCRDIGLHPTLITNAQALANREVAEGFRAAGVRDFLVSVQGLGAAYDAIVGRPGAHERQMRGLRNLRAVGIPFRFNVVMSRLAMPQLPWIARLAIDTGAQVVNFLAFNPFDDQRTGKRSTDNVPRYGELRQPLTAALDLLAQHEVEANVRYLPLCMVEQRHRPSMYNFQQLSWDHHENDFASWRWTFEQPQRTRLDALGRPPQLGPKLGLDRLRAALRIKLFGRALRGWSLSARLGPAIDDLLVRLENGLFELARRLPFSPGVDARYRHDARVRAHRDLGYRHVAACARCDLSPICDGFHSDYRRLFGGCEATAVAHGQRVDDPLHYIRTQSKVVQPEDHDWALPAALTP